MYFLITSMSKITTMMQKLQPDMLIQTSDTRAAFVSLQTDVQYREGCRESSQWPYVEGLEDQRRDPW